MKLKLLAVVLGLTVSMGANATGWGNNGNTTNNNQTYNQGGKGGSAVAGVVNSGNSSNKNLNLNSNKNTNLNANINANKNVNTNKNTTKNSNNANQKTDVTVEGDDYEAAASGGNAASMSPSAQCMGVVTTGVGVPGVTASFGKSYESTQCNYRELVRILSSLGQKEAAIEVTCQLDGAEHTSLCANKETEVSTKATSTVNVATSPLIGH